MSYNCTQNKLEAFLNGSYFSYSLISCLHCGALTKRCDWFKTHCCATNKSCYFGFKLCTYSTFLNLTSNVLLFCITKVTAFKESYLAVTRNAEFLQQAILLFWKASSKVRHSTRYITYARDFETIYLTKPARNETASSSSSITFHSVYNVRPRLRNLLFNKTCAERS